MRSIFLAGCLSACIGSPQPEVPSYIVTTTGERVDLEGFVSLVEPTVLSAGPYLWTINLDDETPPRVIAIQPGGEFEIVSAGVEGEEIRIQVRDGSTRRAPEDLVLSDPPSQGPRPLAHCLVLDPPFDLRLGALPSIGASSEAQVAISNQCDEPVDLVTTVRAGQLFSIVDAPARLEPRTSGRALVRFTSDSLDPAEEIVFIRASTSSVTDRRPITVSTH
jgi:hypothetical protein